MYVYKCVPMKLININQILGENVDYTNRMTLPSGRHSSLHIRKVSGSDLVLRIELSYAI
jgi:hypothetical protein